MDILTWTTNNSDKKRTSIVCSWLPEDFAFFIIRNLDVLWTFCGLCAMEEMKMFLSVERKTIVIVGNESESSTI
jgi:hypothetical protein